MAPTGHPRCRFLVCDLPSGTGFPRHLHDVHQLISVERGSVAVGTASTRWAVPARRGVWLTADLHHDVTAIDDASVVFAYISPSTGWSPPAPGLVVLRPLLREIVAQLARPAGVRGERRERLEGVLLDELGAVEPEPFSVVLPTDGPARAVADRLLAEPDGESSLEALARDVGSSPRTLQRRFRLETGSTFQAWRRRARVQSAMGRLADGASVTTVAHQCGFSSASAFVNAFRTELGTTPAAWKRGLDERVGPNREPTRTASLQGEIQSSTCAGPAAGP